MPCQVIIYPTSPEDLKLQHPNVYISAYGSMDPDENNSPDCCPLDVIELDRVKCTLPGRNTHRSLAIPRSVGASSQAWNGVIRPQMGLHMGCQWPAIKDLQPAHALQGMMRPHDYMHMMPHDARANHFGLPAPPGWGQLAPGECHITYPPSKKQDTAQENAQPERAQENAQESKADEGQVIADGSAAGKTKSTTDMAAMIIANMSKGTKRPLETPLTKKESDLAGAILSKMSKGIESPLATPLSKKKKNANKCKDTQKVKPATPLSKEAKQASKHKDTSTKKPASTMPPASPALLKFHGVPKKNPGPLHHRRWTVYTDMTAQSWRVLKNGEKKDKAHWPNDRGCWAPWGRMGGVGGKQGTKQNTEAHILQTKQIDSISQRLGITSITSIYIYVYKYTCKCLYINIYDLVLSHVAQKLSTRSVAYIT